MKITTKYIVCSLIILNSSISGHTQNAYNDSLKRLLRQQKQDTNNVKRLIDLSNSYAFSFADTGVIYAQQALDLAEKLNFDEGFRCYIFVERFFINAR